MGNEARKAFPRLEGLLKDRTVLDIGGAAGPVCDWAKVWDLSDGDAQTMIGAEPESWDVVFSSHCIEHLKDPTAALHTWWRLVKPGGLLIVLAPDEDLYEQHVWPSRFNGDHKATLTAGKDWSWSPVSHSFTEMIRGLPNHKLYSLRTVDYGYDYTKSNVDQTGGGAEASVELVLIKRPPKPEVPALEVKELICTNCRAKFLGVGECYECAKCLGLV